MSGDEVRIRNVVILELGRVGEQGIHVGVIWGWRLGGIRELVIHKESERWPIVEVRGVGRVVSGGDIRSISGRCGWKLVTIWSSSGLGRFRMVDDGDVWP